MGMLDWLRLIRVSGLATIASNTIASLAMFADDLKPYWMLAPIRHGEVRLLWVPLASFLLFASGMLWNDIHDVERDRVLNPRRPLPSGRVSLPAAYVVGVIMSVGALFAGYMATEEHRIGFYSVGVVLSLALLYDFSAKSIPYLGSLVMGSVRASHAVFVLLLLGPEYVKLVLGISHDPRHPPFLLSYPLILGIYIFGVTLVSELESRRARRWELLLGGGLMAGAVGLACVRLVRAHWIVDIMNQYQPAGPVLIAAAMTVALVILVALVLMVSRPFLQAMKTGKQALVGSTVRAALGGIILLDALIATSGHPLAGLPILLLFPLFRMVGSFIRMD
ncbi:MAG: UbiA family prenyltransferase [Planctomycetes bacterium]|nr:UbiA family prenyltransferase [Planctomycetota bacterium]